jgi:Domain of unknown function (DUF4268)
MLSEKSLQKFIFDLCQKTKAKTKLFDRSTCITNNPWIAATIGKYVLLGYDFRKGKSRVTLCLRFPDLNKTNSIYDLLHGEKNDIEREIGCSLDWRRRDAGKESHIVKRFDGGLDYEDWNELHDELVDALVKFEKAFLPRLASLGIKRRR